ncbi:commissureless [Holotrichia oblita]|uniref:Commissureless n=1 Tax=Holotrichia oblita TaxID=644536 RepID=A0ACB9TH98_HOLOL|nr:commissureless [Holotrichia oblita]
MKYKYICSIQHNKGELICKLSSKDYQYLKVEERRREDLEGANAENESLPSYTIVSGLPSYDEALEQLKKVKELSSSTSKDQAAGLDASAKSEDLLAQNPQLQTISVIELFQLYKNVGQPESAKV